MGCIVAIAADPLDAQNAPDGNAQPIRLIRVQVEAIELPHERMTALLLQPRSGTNDRDLRQQLVGMVAKGEATVLETMICIARSGQKAVSQSGQEYIYPTSYQAPQSPEADTPAQAPTPSEFETRDLGSSLEIEPTLGEDNSLIDLRFVPSITYHVGNEDWAEWKDDLGDRSVKMPKMYSLRVNTSASLLAGEPLFIAAVSPKDADGHADFTRKVMIFVRCDVLTAGGKGVAAAAPDGGAQLVDRTVEARPRPE